jgi:4'-phosphopantetheinyl transferase
MTVNIEILELPTLLGAEVFETLRDSLTEEQKEQVDLYLKIEDQKRYAAARYLLRKLFSDQGYPADFDNNSYGKPFLKNGPEFNFTHANRYIVLAYSKEGSVGVDIEDIRPLQIDLLRRYVSDQEWETMRASDNAEKQFLTYWTAKEAIMKADGRGLSIPIENIHLSGSTALLENREWHLSILDIDENYIARLATSKAPHDIKIQRKSLSELISA